MPVFSRVTEGVLVVTVDGDYTSAELRRVGGEGITNPERPSPGPVLLDMSGAAGMKHKPAGELLETSLYFGTFKESVTRVGILAPSDLVFGMMNQAILAAGDSSLEARPFRTRGEAITWLLGGAAPE